MDLRSLVDQVAKLAHMAGTVIPGAELVGDAADLGNKIISVIDAVSAHATPDQQPELQAARAKLADAVRAKAAATSSRLRG